ncbi:MULTISPECIES: bifunctional 2-C-methyl-D-erythritol 4-phosphate cytidylyltransferase/2-C-methyl-D-erythritol 2,4-cyclodiphosphate synthase [unclassified Campylobacter]|uniref:bifunctional 2-C-methyl-D-erythritol 4-phosphate cytidylyltransferase/2-C-methyl-D-erythritol 2,4-cyclodiphosphate synthase n=1 Tax=unclassified Campylobacter TaxID=2593542 RepID=UPI0022E9BEFA|nr:MULTISPECIES: bifunctional 2-C-methyl-D-erythritol 4-phosphate cytidylyltransferase/2-C-methyl-D-erythritol 2,4-cyclodiphosphate synthase [unclassified Campylobacter]MDA3060593.1 bifunctional 2-C-methyl-D-erythritol 4-phosphate cytidylyltransferase/2-C-methyl-D-erythritol 2,4-cyclodiphosphate synthase [Campylobacter sp. VBCF_02 NA5]MDA3070141.1 bifunctional 2-C-methyl-D-erythritol 4-phosphate cytidylyltransferase/2-C-methyl-D-erythritol 2,4-cyclodiphosphate synthase [Campylobacter sp. VBCF_08 
MSEISLVLLAAGDSTRFASPVKKQWLRIGDDPLWLHVAKDLAKKANFAKIIIVANPQDLKYMRSFCDEFEFVSGGDMRQKSLKNALEMVQSEFVLVSDVARASISQNLINSLLENLGKFDCVSPYLGVNDTAYLGEREIARDEIKLIQTPQLSRTNLLKKALQSEQIFTDDSLAIKSVGGSLGFVKGEISARKITRICDLENFDFPSVCTETFCGNGFDVHALEAGSFITLCGVKIPCEYSLIAHSDGDVAIHALIDAMCGAAGIGDIGELFPDTDEAYKGIDSKILLRKVTDKIHRYGFEIVNADITIMAQKPKLSPYKEQMRKALCEILGTKKVNVKATTTEKLGFVGRSEGIAVIASVNLKYFDWKKLLIKD